MAPTTLRLFENGDADRVAAFFNEHGFGPVRRGTPLTGATLLASIRESDVRLLVVAEQHGSIVGSLGYATMSGRRVAGPGEMFATMFIVHPSYRAGFLVGQLFAECFSRFAELGLRTLRVEVDPSNKRAFPMYVRMGFRNAGRSRADEDGFVELVNHLPGLATELARLPLRELAHQPLANSQFTARTLKDARRQTLTSGVKRSVGCATTIDYEMQISGHVVSATVDAVSGEIVKVLVDGVLDTHYGARSAHEVRGQGEVFTRPIDDFSVSVTATDGTLRITHRRHLGPMIVDTFPVSGSSPAGARRPLASWVTTTKTEHGWLSTNGEITRTVDVGPSEVTVNVTHKAGETTTVFPWSGFRAAELSVQPLNSASRQEHAVRGHWPPELTDFESAADGDFGYSSEGAQVRWFDSHTGVGLELEGRSPGRLRIEGPHLARIAESSTHSYRLVPFWHHTKATPAPAPAERGASPLPSERWERTRPGGVEAVRIRDKHTDSQVSVSPAFGLISWRSGGIDILATPATSRAIGPLTEAASALWVATQSDRFDRDHGVEWASHDARFAFNSTGELSWRVLPSEDFSHLDIELRAKAESATAESAAATEAALYLHIADNPSHVDVKVADQWQRVSDFALPWRTWARAFRISCATGVIEAEPLENSHSEVLLRGGSFGVLATMLARLNSESSDAVRWRLTFTNGQ